MKVIEKKVVFKLSFRPLYMSPVDQAGSVTDLNKGSCHYVKLPDRAESGPLKSLYAF